MFAKISGCCSNADQLGQAFLQCKVEGHVLEQALFKDGPQAEGVMVNKANKQTSIQSKLRHFTSEALLLP